MGRLKSATLLIQAVIVLIMTYSCQAWIKMSRSQYNDMENLFRDSIVQILGLPPKTNRELGGR